MNTRQAFSAAALALLASSAFAGGEFYREVAQPAPHEATTQAERAEAPKASGLTRAEVRAEFLRARNAGELVAFDTGMAYAQAPEHPSTLTRAQVLEEARLALRAKGTSASGS